MGHVFFRYVSEDSTTIVEIAKGLEAAGYSTWYFERDSIPGVPYLKQVNAGIDENQAVGESVHE